MQRFMQSCKETSVEHREVYMQIEGDATRRRRGESTIRWSI